VDRFMCPEALEQCDQLIANPLWRRGYGARRELFSHYSRSRQELPSRLLRCFTCPVSNAATGHEILRPVDCEIPELMPHVSKL
jgi:hypothetical protein